VVTALKRAEDGDGVIVRVFNTLDRATTGRVRLLEPWTRAELVDLKEERLRDAEQTNGSVRLKLRSNEIATVRFR
jgi:alpha-mannosidase